jgi:predicted unusual protein kinase regulating ubiquinone biosynthesis (AarF/ABC1/UbiB family)
MKTSRRLVLLRPIVVLRALLPFALSLLRDFHRFLLLGGPRVLSEAQQRERAANLTARIAGLGPTFIKLVQVLAMREDMVPRLYTDEFKKLQDQVPPFPATEAAAIIETEFGRPLPAVFEEFEPVPIAAASLGQVHRAKHAGETVAVKVLRPGVEQLVETDLRIMRFVLAAAQTVFGNHFILRNLVVLVNEFSRVIRDELDFRHELRNIEAFRRTLAPIPHVIVPAVVPDVCGRRVLTTRFYDGVRADDAEHLRSLGIDPMDLLATLVTVYTRMVVVDGLLHADPHPGNLLVMGDGSVVILDYGMVVRLVPDVKRELLRTVAAAVRGDASTLINGFYKLGMVEPGTNMATLRDAARVLLNINYTTTYTPRAIQRIAEDILRTFSQFPLRLPSSLVYLLRAAVLIEGIGITFDERFNALRFATPIIRRVLREVPAEQTRTMLDRAVDLYEVVTEFAGNLERIVFRAEREELRIRVHPSDLSEIEGYFTRVQRRILVGMAGTTIAIVTAIIYTRTLSLLLLFAGEALALLIFLALIVLPIHRAGRDR